MKHVIDELKKEYTRLQIQMSAIDKALLLLGDTAKAPPHKPSKLRQNTIINTVLDCVTNKPTHSKAVQRMVSDKLKKKVKRHTIDANLSYWFSQGKLVRIAPSVYQAA